MAEDMPDYASYVICTAPRSGSTLLCRLLAATGVAGNPSSLFHKPSLADWLDSFGLTPSATERETLAAIFAAAIERGTGGTGLFGLRLQRHSFGFFMEKLGLLHPGPRTDTARIEAAFGRTLFLHLTRADKVAQAVSLQMAEQTGLWHAAPDGSEIERTAPHRAPAYDGDRIAEEVATLTTYDRDWLDWFEREGIAPLRITYDALSEDPRGTLRTILAALGRDPSAAEGVAPGTRKLADATSLDWIARFRSERAAG